MKYLLILILSSTLLYSCFFYNLNRNTVEFTDPCNNESIFYYSSSSGSGDIYKINTLSLESSIFIDNDSTDGAPRYNAFENELIFTSLKEGAPYLYAKNLDTGIESWKMLNPAGDEVPDWSPIKNEFVYSKATGSGLFDLVIRDLTINIETVLVEDATSDFYPSWSPDGTKILFEYSDSTSTNDIAIINSNGSGFKKIAAHKYYGHPSWAPNGKSVLFYIYQDGQADIYSANIDGTNLTQLTNTPSNELIARYSSDGSKILIGGIVEDDWEVFLMDSDGGNIKRLTNTSGFDGDPIWISCK